MKTKHFKNYLIFALCLLLTFVCTLSVGAAESTAPDGENENGYEVVSFTKPDKLSYTSADITEEINDDGKTVKYIYPDTAGIVVTVRHKESGNVFTIDGDRISADGVLVNDAEITNQTFTAEASAFIYDDEYDSKFVDFSFEIYYNTDNSGNKMNSDAPNDSTPDTPVASNTDNQNNANGAIPTGDMYTLINIVCMFIIAGACVFLIEMKLRDKN